MYNDSISKIINYINQGECIQVVFSQRFEKSIAVHPLEIYMWEWYIANQYNSILCCE